MVKRNRRVVEDKPVEALTAAGERILRNDPARFARVLLLVEQIADAYEGHIDMTPGTHWPASLDASADAC